MITHQDKGIIFDLDQTLVDTSSFQELRDKRNWNAIYQQIHDLEINPQVIKLLSDLSDHKWTIMVVSSSREEYVGWILEEIGNYFFDDYLGNAGATADSKADKYVEILDRNNIKIASAYSVGDSQLDIDAANKIGIASVGVSWWRNEFPENSDISSSSPIELLNYLEPNENREIVLKHATSNDLSVYSSEQGQLSVCRGAHPSTNGIEYHIAFVCLNCKIIYEPSDLLEQKKEIDSFIEIKIENQENSQSYRSLDDYLFIAFGKRFNEGPGWLMGKKARWFTQYSSKKFYCPSCKMLNEIF